MNNRKLSFSTKDIDVFKRLDFFFFTVTLAVGLQLTKGKHVISLELRNAGTGWNCKVSDWEIESDSSFRIYKIYKKMDIRIPYDGIYFTNIYVDGDFVSSKLISIKTN